MIKVEQEVIHGSEQQIIEHLAGSPSKTINTSYIERSNLDWRLWDAHLARKALTFARFTNYSPIQYNDNVMGTSSEIVLSINF